MLKPGWSNIIYDHIWNQLKLPCPFHFKNAKVNRILGEIFYKLRENVSSVTLKLIFMVPMRRVLKVCVYKYLPMTLETLFTRKNGNYEEIKERMS